MSSEVIVKKKKDTRPLPPQAEKYALELLKASRILRTQKIAEAFGLTKSGLLNLEKKEAK